MAKEKEKEEEEVKEEVKKVTERYELVEVFLI